jgi:voltage-gated potassium channel Kch
MTDVDQLVTGAATGIDRAVAESASIIGVMGCGVTGQAVGRILRARQARVAWFDIAAGAAVRASRRLGGVVLDSAGDLGVVDVVVLASPTPQADLALMFLDDGRDVVSLSDDPDDVEQLLALHDRAVASEARLVVGAALSPGLSGVLARHLAGQLAVVDEIHVAAHGTGGPACARQHHDALGTRALGWHDGEWIERPGGSGRELCWFPEPIGSADCYRAALADPIVLHRAFPGVDRISARVSANRRDRLTARLPMLAPPHGEGDRGALRVEVRGALDTGERVTHVVGAVGRTGDLAGTVGALFAQACVDRRCPPGVTVAGDDATLGAWLLGEAVEAGVQLQEYTGVARASEW